MDQSLKQRVKELGLLPTVLDEEARAFYESIGQDPSKVEIHINPNTPPAIAERQLTIMKSVNRLRELEQAKNFGKEYNSVEQEVKDAVQDLLDRGCYMGASNRDNYSSLGFDTRNHTPLV